MDSEAAVIRSEMSRTRAELDRKLSTLEARAHALSPRAYARRHMPDYLAERVIGTVLTGLGVRMAWKQWRSRSTRRERMRQVYRSDVCW